MLPKRKGLRGAPALFAQTGSSVRASASSYVRDARHERGSENLSFTVIATNLAAVPLRGSRVFPVEGPRYE